MYNEGDRCLMEPNTMPARYMIHEAIRKLIREERVKASLPGCHNIANFIPAGRRALARVNIKGKTTSVRGCRFDAREHEKKSEILLALFDAKRHDSNRLKAVMESAK